MVIPLGPASSLGRVILAPLTLSCAYAIFVPRENAEKGGWEGGRLPLQQVAADWLSAEAYRLECSARSRCSKAAPSLRRQCDGRRSGETQSGANTTNWGSGKKKERKTRVKKKKRGTLRRRLSLPEQRQDREKSAWPSRYTCELSS